MTLFKMTPMTERPSMGVKRALDQKLGGRDPNMSIGDELHTLFYAFFLFGKKGVSK